MYYIFFRNNYCVRIPRVCPSSPLWGVTLTGALNLYVRNNHHFLKTDSELMSVFFNGGRDLCTIFILISASLILLNIPVFKAFKIESAFVYIFITLAN